MGLHHVKEIEDHFNNCLSRRPLLLKDFVFKGLLEGSTPLQMACHYGELVSVKRIVESWGVDVNLASTYYIDVNSTAPIIEMDYRLILGKATPLFIAAHMGHWHVVRYLVAHGADVSAKSLEDDDGRGRFGLTPLYEAVYYDCHGPSRPLNEQRKRRAAIVRLLLEAGADPSSEAFDFSGYPMWASKICGVDAITALIDHGMDVNYRIPDTGETILNYWARRSMDRIEEESLAVVQMLLDRGADLHTQNRSGFTPIINAAHSQNLAVLDFLLERNDISRKEKIDALELAGAVILSDTKHRPLFPKAFKYWRRALHLRSMVTNECGPIFKTPKNLKTDMRVVEWTTLEELEKVIQNPSQHVIQSFLVRLKILSSRNWVAVISFFSDYTDNKDGIFSKLMDQRRFVELLNMQWSMLESIRCFEALEIDLWPTTLEIVYSLIKTLLKLERNDPLLNMETITTSLKLILATDQFHLNNRESPDHGHLYCHIYSMVRLIAILADLPQLMNKDSYASLSEWVRRDQRQHPDGQSLLHITCRRISPDDMASLRLLLRAGADPDSADHQGDRPLHALAESYCFSSIESIESAARLLLDSGAFLDRTNKKGETAADVLKKTIERQRSHSRLPGQELIEDNFLVESWFLHYDSVPKLKFQSGRVVRSQRVPYSHLPPILHRFVELQHK